MNIYFQDKNMDLEIMKIERKNRMSEKELKNYGDLILKNIEEQAKRETDLMLQNKRLKEVLDNIKEYITTRTPSDIGISGNKPKKYYTLSEDEVDYILELLEEIE